MPAGKSIVKAAIESPTANILFYSSNPNYMLIDFACKDDADRILAFQATTSSTHTADVEDIADMEDAVEYRGLMLYYLHPARPKRFKFATDPAKPKTRFCRVFHVEILKPSEAKEILCLAGAAEEPGND